jgi:hypothetical protein
MQPTIPRVGDKIKDKGKGPIVSTRKNMKVHKVPHVYNLIENDMDIIGYQVQDIAEEAIEEETRNQA